MVGVVQWLERLVVDQEAGGSNPLTHPDNRRLKTLISKKQDTLDATRRPNIRGNKERK